jgi:glycosyltransferase involved in cell wall biosynthesis
MAHVIWIAVPCYNEQHRLDGDAFVAYAREHPAVHFCFVNDGSRDQTQAVLESVAQRLGGQGQVLTLAHNSGKPEAVRQGMLRGIDEGASEVGYWDADLATPLSAIALLHETLASGPGLDAAIGSRVRLLGRHIDRKLHRHLLGRVFATFTSLLLDLPVYDTQCGAKLFRATPGFAAALSQGFMVNWPFDVELLLRLTVESRRRHGEGLLHRVVEVPLPQWCDIKGSKVSCLGMVHSAVDLLRLWRVYGRAGVKRGVE